MYEMIADPATTGAGVMWHVRAKGDARTTLCGLQVAQTVRTRPVFDDPPTERYCSPCMTAVHERMQSEAR
ncbi:hypothetical protein ACFWNT_36965 [Streptomyces sp. NPDC058409]|uniref:hypothetical protein n=1 Tax=Streptomyces sp. NPDC058409 TaxID=3346484 RepID=UPI0036592143